MTNFERHRPYQPTDVLNRPEDDAESYCSENDFGENDSDDDNDESTLETEFRLAESKEDWQTLKSSLIPCLEAGIVQLNRLQATVLARVAESIDAVQDGKPGVKLLILGKAGVGKSFLLKMVSLLLRAKCCGYESLPSLRCAYTGKSFFFYLLIFVLFIDYLNLYSVSILILFFFYCS